MDILLLVTAGSDTGPFDLYENSTGTFVLFEQDVSKNDLTDPLGYSTVVPSGTTVVRVQSKGVCSNYIDITLVPDTTSTTTTAVPGTTCDCYALSALPDPLTGFGLTFLYYECGSDDIYDSIYVAPEAGIFICSKYPPVALFDDPENPRGNVNKLTDPAPCGGCPPSSTTTSTTTCAVYYELSGCNPEDYAFTKIVPTLGTGQQYVLPGSPNVYYTYTGVSSTYCTAPAQYNASIQATANIGCL